MPLPLLTRPHRKAALEVFRCFLALGLTSFGGPVAHIGYFRAAFVVRRRWLGEAAFADLVALCQFLPGPASSQVGFAIGLLRAGPLGGLAAWVGFTLPSAIIMLVCALGVPRLGHLAPVIHGLKLVAAAIVAQAVWGMARSLCPDRTRASIAAAGACVLLVTGAPGAHIGVILGGAAAGFYLCRGTAAQSGGASRPGVPRAAGVVALVVFAGLLCGLPLLAGWLRWPWLAHAAAFYRAGALVFGGGHVVLPLLRDGFVTSGWVSGDDFMAGYGLTQAMPGPLFTFAAYLGAIAGPVPLGWGGAATGVAAIFLPGMLVLIGALPFWGRVRGYAPAQAILQGVNAAVVGVLGAALYTPLWTSSVSSPASAAFVVAGFTLLTVWRAPPILIVLAGAGFGFFV